MCITVTVTHSLYFWSIWNNLMKCFSFVGFSNVLFSRSLSEWLAVCIALKWIYSIIITITTKTVDKTSEKFATLIPSTTNFSLLFVKVRRMKRQSLKPIQIASVQFTHICQNFWTEPTKPCNRTESKTYIVEIHSLSIYRLNTLEHGFCLEIRCWMLNRWRKTNENVGNKTKACELNYRRSCFCFLFRCALSHTHSPHSHRIHTHTRVCSTQCNQFAWISNASVCARARRAPSNHSLYICLKIAHAMPFLSLKC